jgi:predicted RNase H-like HicB family nuclease
MTTRTMTLMEVHQAGLAALAERLGPVGMVRFLQQFETGHGDYSVERHTWLEPVDVKTLAERIRAHKKDNLYVVEYPEVSTASQGYTVEAAPANLREAAEPYPEESPPEEKDSSKPSPHTR